MLNLDLDQVIKASPHLMSWAQSLYFIYSDDTGNKLQMAASILHTIIVHEMSYDFLVDKIK